MSPIMHLQQNLWSPSLSSSQERFSDCLSKNQKCSASYELIKCGNKFRTVLTVSQQFCFPFAFLPPQKKKKKKKKQFYTSQSKVSWKFNSRFLALKTNRVQQNWSQYKVWLLTTVTFILSCSIPIYFLGFPGKSKIICFFLFFNNETIEVIA